MLYMDDLTPRISSAEFRKTYAKLTVLTGVTVNGRLMGIWIPAVEPTPVLPPERTGMVFASQPLKSRADVGAWTPEDDHRAAAAPRVVTSANPPSFRPVPKPARKK